MDRIALSGLRDDRVAILVEDPNRIRHVVPDVASAYGLAVQIFWNVVNLPDLNGPHVSVFRETRRHEPDVSPPIGSNGRYRHGLRAENQIWFADRPPSGIDSITRRRHVSRIAPGSSVVHPRLDLCQLLVAE